MNICSERSEQKKLLKIVSLRGGAKNIVTNKVKEAQPWFAPTGEIFYFGPLMC